MAQIRLNENVSRDKLRQRLDQHRQSLDRGQRQRQQTQRQPQQEQQQTQQQQQALAQQAQEVYGDMPDYRQPGALSITSPQPSEEIQRKAAREQTMQEAEEAAPAIPEAGAEEAGIDDVEQRRQEAEQRRQQLSEQYKQLSAPLPEKDIENQTEKNFWNPEEDDYFWGTLSKKDIENAGMTIGGTAGSIIGGLSGFFGFGGPVGTAVGGTAGGSLGTGIGRNVAGFLTGEGAEEMATETAKAMRDDTMWSLGLMNMGGGTKQLARAFLGISPDKARRVVDEDLNVLDAAFQRKAEAENNSAITEQYRNIREKITGQRVADPQIPSLVFAESDLPFKFQGVLGNLPFAGMPLHRGRKKARKTIDDLVEEELDPLNTVAPNASLQSLGVDVMEAAKNADEEFKTISRNLYNQAENTARKLGDPDIIPMHRVRKVAEDLQMADEMFRPEEMPDPQRTIARRIRDGIAGTDKTHESFTGVRQMQADINKILRSGRADNFDKKSLGQLQEALNDAMLQAAHPSRHASLDVADAEMKRAMGRAFQEGQAPRTEIPQEIGQQAADRMAQESGEQPRRIMSGARPEQTGPFMGAINNLKELDQHKALDIFRKQLNFANMFYAQGMDRYRTKAARKFEQASPNIFGRDPRSGYSNPSITEDELIKRIIPSRSPDMMRQTKSLIGRDKFSEVAKKNLQETMEIAKDSADRTGKFDYKAISSKLGLDTKAGREAFDEMFKDTDLNPQTLKRLIDHGATLDGMNLREASTFLARRLTLGGAQSLTSMGYGAAAFGTGGGSVAATMPILGLTWGLSSLMGNRRALQGIADITDPKAPRWLHRYAAGSMINSLDSTHLSEASGVPEEDIEKTKEELDRPLGNALMDINSKDSEPLKPFYDSKGNRTDKNPLKGRKSRDGDRARQPRQQQVRTYETGGTEPENMGAGTGASGVSRLPTGGN